MAHMGQKEREFTEKTVRIPVKYEREELEQLMNDKEFIEVY